MREFAKNWRAWWRMEPGSSLLEYCVVSWHVALIPSILLVAAAYALFSGAGGDVAALQKPARDIAHRDVWITVLAAPLVESLLLALGLRVIGLVTRNRQVIAIVSALAWGALHGYFYPIWFFGTAWSFYVFSRGYLAWRPVSYKHALGAAAVPHALVNSSALLVQFFAS